MSTDPRKMRPGELCRLLNSTPAGEVISDQQLRRDRTRAGLRVGEGKTVDLVRYVAWLAHQRHAPASDSDVLDSEALAAMQLPSLKIVAELFGVRYDTVKVWRRNGMPGEKGAYPLVGVVQWRLANEDTAGTDAKGQLKRDLELRRLEAQVLIQERKAGRLVDPDQVGQEVTRVLAVLRRALQRLPAVISPQLPAESRADLLPHLERNVNRLLSATVKELQALAEPDSEEQP